MPSKSYAQVVLPLALSEAYTYAVPDELAATLEPGCRVEVPFRRRRMVGVVAALLSESPQLPLKPVLSQIDPEPMLNGELLGLLAWVADYYFAPPGEVVRLALPPGFLTPERRRIALGARGRMLMGGLPLAGLQSIEAGEQRRLLAGLKQLPSSGEIDLDSFLKACGRLDHSVLKRWEESAFIRMRSSPPGGGLKVRTATFVSPSVALKEGLPLLERTPKQTETFRRLSKIGEARRSDFVAGDPGAARALSQLIRRGLVETRRREVARSPLPYHQLLEAAADARPPSLTLSQKRAVETIVEAIRADRHPVFLLYGPPGSGKTEVYLQAASAVLERERSVLFLVPEIALTPQLVSRVAGRFGSRVAVWHSGLSAGERLDEWRRMRRGDARVVVGARSAVFAPLPQIGLVVVDEEQDGSYKSEDHVYYQARDVAVMRARRAGAPVILGSATPSVESVHNARAGRYVRLDLERFERQTPPAVTLIDMAERRVSRRSMLSSELILAVERRLEAGEQVILFLNRRGYAPHLICRSCKRTVDCRRCSVTMAYHRSTGRLICHSCGISAPFPAACPACGREELELVGVGTQRVEDELELTFPKARIARLDRDAMARRGALGALLNRFQAREIDILVGTQLVTKGHDFPGVTLVGVLSADQSLNYPDFRAAERSYQLLVQVAGRSGRHDRPGEVIIQTFQPENVVLECVRNHETDPFYERELAARRGLYPPFRRLALLRIEGPDEAAAFERANRIARRLRKLAGRVKEHRGIALLGPSQAPIFRLRGQYRFRVLIKAETAAALHRFLRPALERGLLTVGPKMKLIVDVDPNMGA